MRRLKKTFSTSVASNNGIVSICRADRSQMVCGTLLDGFLGQIHEHRGFLVTDPVHLARRYLHFLAGKPVPGFDDQLTNRPALGVHHKIADVADVPSVARRW